jgi:hypothetical protein
MWGPIDDSSRSRNRPFLRGRTIDVLALLTAGLVVSSCGPSQAEVTVAVAPNPVPIGMGIPCAGVPAIGNCLTSPPPSYLGADWTVSVATRNDIGGRGIVEVLVVDAATGQPVVDQGTLRGDLSVVLGPHTSTSVAVRWVRLLMNAGPSRIVPPQLAFVITVDLTDTMGNRFSETVTVPERLPRSWEVFP